MRLSDAAVKYAYNQWLSSKSGANASPSRPPSPSGSTPGTSPAVLTRPPGVTRGTRPPPRSATSPDPSGRKTSPHGISMLSAISPVTRGRPVPLGLGDSVWVGDSLVAGDGG